MSNISVGAHVVAALLVLLQCGLAAVLAYRLFLLSQTSHGVDPHRRPTNVNMMKMLRLCLFIMTILQCVRCIDPFSTLGIWPYFFARSIQLAVTFTIYFQYSATTYIVMDTLYACALKRTPDWLAMVVFIIPVSYFVVGVVMLGAEFAVGQQWVSAVVSFYAVVMLTVNTTTYNVSGVILIRMLRNHQVIGSNSSVEDISGAKSASPFELVIAKTRRSMAILTFPSAAGFVVFVILGVVNLNTKPLLPFNTSPLPWSVLAVLYIQLVLGILFTRVAWVSKTALETAILAKTVSTPSSVGSETPDQKRASRTASRADLKERALRLSQSPIPRISPQLSHPEQEAGAVSAKEDSQEVAVFVKEDSQEAAVAISQSPVALARGAPSATEIV